jgi:hypothetical protein
MLEAVTLLSATVCHWSNILPVHLHIHSSPSIPPPLPATPPPPQHTPSRGERVRQHTSLLAVARDLGAQVDAASEGLAARQAAAWEAQLAALEADKAALNQVGRRGEGGRGRGRTGRPRGVEGGGGLLLACRRGVVDNVHGEDMATG